MQKYKVLVKDWNVALPVKMFDGEKQVVDYVLNELVYGGHPGAIVIIEDINAETVQVIDLANDDIELFGVEYS